MVDSTGMYSSPMIGLTNQPVPCSYPTGTTGQKMTENLFQEAVL